MYRSYSFLFVILLCWTPTLLRAQQPPVWRDSVRQKVKIMRELLQEQNYEAAQLEADTFRAIIRQQQLAFPPEAITLVSAVYFHNKDRKSALFALGEAEISARRVTAPAARISLLTALAKEQERWGNTERARVVQQWIDEARDSLATLQVKDRTRHYQHQIDSLQQALTSANIVRNNTITLDRTRVYAFIGIVALIFLALILSQLGANNRWRRRWNIREQEWELRHAATPVPVPEPEHSGTRGTAVIAQEGVAEMSAYSIPQEEARFYADKTPPVALVVESNRQIALYMRSMLNSNFQVETAATPTEALKIAHELLPDLVVCDAHLEGNTGIDVVRQIKLSERTNHIPVILLSRHFGNDGRLDALRAGADAWFTRPMQSEDFSLTVQHLIEGHKERHEDFARYLQLYYTGSRPEQPSRFLSDTIAFIEQDMANPDLMPDEIAKKMQMPNVLFSRKLRALTGKDSARVIRELRLEKAKFLLEKQAGTPQAIAEMTGFSNIRSFSMAFKDYFGENTMLLTTGNNKRLPE